jgi:hypothetical protein
VTEFGAKPGTPAGVDPRLGPADQWRNGNNFLYHVIPDGVFRLRTGETIPSWEGSIVVDCAAPRYHAFLLDQARRHVAGLPDSAGISIDRLDWLRLYNFQADDGVSWIRGRPCRSLYSSWAGLMAEMGPLFHGAGKVIYVNLLVNRTELLRQADAVYDEHGDWPWEVNGLALQCVRRTCVTWTHGEKDLGPDPDAFFQRYLHLGVFPTAPVPGNDHAILPSPSADRWYLDYGPLLRALRGRTWALTPHAVDVTGGAARANVFVVPEGYAVPVTFGGTASSATVHLRLPGLPAGRRCEALYPCDERPAPLTAALEPDGWRIRVPLRRGCALVRIPTRLPPDP